MPLIATLHHGEMGKTYLWRIDEQVEYFTESLENQGLDLQAVDGWHPSRQLEWLAGRHLVDIFTETPLSELLIMPTGKPYFPNQKEYFSISHSGGYVALSISDQPVGLDIQLKSNRLSRLRHKFLHDDDERDSPYNDLDTLHFVWSAKEAIFKCYGEGQLDFKTDMRIIFSNDFLSGSLNNSRANKEYYIQEFLINNLFIVAVFEK